MFAPFLWIIDLRGKKKLETKKIRPYVEYYYLGMEKERGGEDIDFIQLPAIILSPFCTTFLFFGGSAPLRKCGFYFKGGTETT